MILKNNIFLGLLLAAGAIWTNCTNDDSKPEVLDLALPAKDKSSHLSDWAKLAEEQSAVECDDGIDNDNDLLIDCNDPSCHKTAPCKGLIKDIGVAIDQPPSGPDGCVPQCENKSCGPDGCNGECGQGCKSWQSCTASGQCMDLWCIPMGEQCPWGVGSEPECCDTINGFLVSCNLQAANMGVCCVAKSFRCGDSNECCSGYTCKIVSGIPFLTCQP